MRILVTGGAGFIGSCVADTLIGAGHDVRILDVLLPAAHPAYPSGRPGYSADLDLRVADVRDRSAVATALSGVEAVVHQAAMVGLGTGATDLPDYVGINDLGTAVLLEAMADAGVGRLVVAGSMVVYGEGRYLCRRHGAVRPGPREEADLAAGVFEPRCPHCAALLTPGAVEEDAPLDPRNVYAATKVAQEHLASAWARMTGGAAIALRYHNVYGPRMPRDTPYAGVASLFRSALERGIAPRVFEDGGQRRDFVHVADVAEANRAALAATDRPGFRAYNVASGQVHTVGEMARALADALGGPEPVVTGEYRLGDVRHVTASPDRAAAELGFRARWDFEAGMKEFAAAPLRG
ncbi:NAD-dependent epimerase/dehydratase family protein [Cryptosporangium phraense]|uniref:UDP-glucose 4-epimerase n=1 Tax=Cryptosporangium phraense TaxID=2593070 RepID=A0A545AP95_9ACTN|nr:NAD-dependent epimerase/dehydratase family protein [Cryptosporangium phraense]TQS43081.1 NAD-dependent epimerase/dehydratase family protein [Cryptosporangium phraense]